MKNLPSRTEITKKPAHKGAASVVLNASDYIQEVYSELVKSKFQERRQGVPKNEYAHIVATELRKMFEQEEYPTLSTK